MKSYIAPLLLIVLVLAVSGACTPAPWQPISLASFSENYVEVSIYLDRGSSGDYLLSAAFTPPQGFHLYSKDIPVNGVSGQGRPTLLELTENSHLRAMGGLSENVSPERLGYGPEKLLVYPAGPVRLTLPIKLPAGNGWIDDEVKITYMVCNEYQCKPPVEGKIVPIRIPGIDAVKN